MRIALGLDLDLEDFAHEHGADTFRAWGLGERWRDRLIDIASRDDTEIYWNLTGVAIDDGLLRAARGSGGGTDWELSQFYRNTGWLRRCRWFRDGVEVDQPVELT